MLWSLVGVLVLIASWIDVQKRIIPNWLNLTGIILGLSYHAWQGTSLFGLKGLFWGLFFGVLFWGLGQMGAGDAKLFAAIGSIVGADHCVTIFFLTLFFFVLYGIPVRLRKEGLKKFIEREKTGILLFLSPHRMRMMEMVGEDEKKPLAPFVALGTAAVCISSLLGVSLYGI